ncbi:MAG: hypothetical protein K1X29_01175 [Bdellovibrionales bacterium]|nr:hypothetical protein [Bdellovibrionales bacterium]
MTNKTYEFAGYTFKTYFKKAGQGYEIGLTSGGKTYFFSNFTSSKEANKWWSQFNKLITGFYKKFKYTDENPRQFYGEFMATYLYKAYYTFLTDLFRGYDRFYNKEFGQKYQKYERMMKDMAA